MKYQRKRTTLAIQNQTQKIGENKNKMWIRNRRIEQQQREQKRGNA
jgi:hypothetical protein